MAELRKLVTCRRGAGQLSGIGMMGTPIFWHILGTPIFWHILAHWTHFFCEFCWRKNSLLWQKIIRQDLIREWMYSTATAVGSLWVCLQVSVYWRLKIPGKVYKQQEKWLWQWLESEQKTSSLMVWEALENHAWWLKKHTHKRLLILSFDFRQTNHIHLLFLFQTGRNRLAPKYWLLWQTCGHCKPCSVQESAASH